MRRGRGIRFRPPPDPRRHKNIEHRTGNHSSCSSPRCAISVTSKHACMHGPIRVPGGPPGVGRASVSTGNVANSPAVRPDCKHHSDGVPMPCRPGAAARFGIRSIQPGDSLSIHSGQIRFKHSLPAPRPARVAQVKQQSVPRVAAGAAGRTHPVGSCIEALRGPCVFLFGMLAAHVAPTRPLRGELCIAMWAREPPRTIREGRILLPLVGATVDEVQRANEGAP